MNKKTHLGFVEKPKQPITTRPTREQRVFANRVTALAAAGSRLALDPGENATRANIKCLPGDLMLPGDKLLLSSATKKLVAKLDVLQVAKFEAEIVLYLQALAQVYLLKKGLEAEWGFNINKTDLILSYIPGFNLKVYTLTEWEDKAKQGINPRN